MRRENKLLKIMDEEREQAIIQNGLAEEKAILLDKEREQDEDREEAFKMDLEREQTIIMDEEREQANIYNGCEERTSYYIG